MMDLLTVDQIAVQATALTKEEAIKQAGQLLVDNGVVAPTYVEGMLLREQTMSTYIGNGVAIPHGTYDHLGDIKRTGISVLQLPKGVVWEEEDGEQEVAYLVIGIAANSDEHIGILSNLAEVMEDEETVEMLANTEDPLVILEMLNKKEEEGIGE